MFVSFGFEFSNFFNSRHRSKVGGNSDSRQGIAIRRSLLQNVNRCEKQQNYYVTSTSRELTPELPDPKLGSRDQIHVWSENFLVDDFYKKHSNGILFRNLEQLIQLFAENLPAKSKVAVLPAASIQILAQEIDRKV